jgi:hypothetical protein
MPKLYKVDTSAWTVRGVDGEPYPGSDGDGEVCYDNTHFLDEEAAWAKLLTEAQAGVLLAGRAVARLKDALRDAETEAGSMCAAAARVHDAVRRRTLARENGRESTR